MVFALGFVPGCAVLGALVGYIARRGRHRAREARTRVHS